MRRTPFIGMLIATFAFGAAGCSSSSQTTRTGKAEAALRRVHSCGELEQMLKTDALTKMNKQIDNQLAMIEQYGQSGGGFGIGAEPPRAGVDDAKGEATNGAPSDPGSSGGQGLGAAPQHSDTNSQVADVDEADIVETDGNSIYLLHGNTFTVLHSWPAPELALSGSTQIEGEPSEMFVDGNNVVVYSRVDGRATYEAAGVTPRNPYSDGYAYGGGMGKAEPAIAPDCRGGDCGGGFYFQSPLTKITVLTLNGAQASVARELYFEGDYREARRMGTKVRTILNGTPHGPALQYYPSFTNEASYPQTKDEWIAAYEALRASNTAAINASTATDWLPYMMTKTGNTVSASTAACADFYVPGEGTTEFGMTEIASIDLAAPDRAPTVASIVAAADTVYANADSLYIAARGWQEPRAYGTVGVGSSSGGGSTGSGSAGEATPPSPPSSSPPAPKPDGIGTLSDTPSADYVTMNFTHLHKFDLKTDPSVPVYVASGTVAGQVLNQFSLDERNGVLRISTNEQRYQRAANGSVSNSDQVNHVFALRAEQTSLRQIGSVGDLAKGESIFSTRFVADRAYVVTFRQVDPLFVIDMSDPSAPRVLGSLKIPGFSEYMHPLDDTHLLTIGQSVEDNRRAGVALQIFDVSDATHPARTSLFEFSGEQYGHSDAEYNHKAFTYFAEKKLLTFPFYAYDNSGMRSSAELFRVDTATGIERLGSVDHTSLLGSNTGGYCGGYFTPQVRRGVFIEDVLYSISYAGVVATKTADLSTLASVSLPSPSIPGAPMCGAR